MARAVWGLPMHRSEALVGDVIESLLGQDFDDFAIVALDDGSDDGSVAVARRHAAQDPRMTVEANPKRQGMIRTWNRVLGRTGARVGRQRAALFGPRPPLTSYLPISVQHAGWLAERLVVRRRRPDGIDRAEGAAIAGRYLARWVTLEPQAAPLRRRLGIETKRLQRRWKGVRKAARACRRALRAAVRGAVLAAPAGKRAYRRLRNRS
jgi:glycosyltransferase involved in cell wall biosynthesis